MRSVPLLLLLPVLLSCQRDSYGIPPDIRQLWESDNPLREIPAGPLGSGIDLSRPPIPPTPARVRLGRWLFFDARLSRD